MPRGGFSACRSGGGGPEEEGPDGHGHGDHDELEKVGVFVEVLRALARVAFAAVRRLGRLPAWQRRLALAAAAFAVPLLVPLRLAGPRRPGTSTAPPAAVAVGAGAARAAPTLLGSTSQMAVRGLQAVRESAKNAPFGGTRPVGGHRTGEHSEKRVDKFVRWAVYKLDIMLEQHP